MERRVRLLIVDDRARSRDGLRTLLATRPEVEVVGDAANGEEAVHLVEACRPDVVLMDARMPSMDGVETARVIKGRWPLVRVVVLSMYPGYRQQALAAGADAFLVKGRPTRELLDAVVNGTARA